MSLEINQKQIDDLHYDINTLFYNQKEISFADEEGYYSRNICFYNNQNIPVEILSRNVVSSCNNGKIFNIISIVTTSNNIFVKWYKNRNIINIEIYGAQNFGPSSKSDQELFESIFYEAGLHLGSNVYLFDRDWGFISVPNENFVDFVEGLIIGITEIYVLGRN